MQRQRSSRWQLRPVSVTSTVSKFLLVWFLERSIPNILTAVFGCFQGLDADHAVVLESADCCGWRIALDDSGGIAKFTANPRVRVTCGETLQNGTTLDLVAAAGRDGLDLLSWDGKERPSIAPAFNCDGVVYEPPDLHPSVRDAMTFPNGAVEYGTVAELFVKTSNLYREHAGMREDLAAFTTSWTLSSWVPEFLLIPLTLCVIGAPMHQVCSLFRLFGSLCRRALLVAELSRRPPLFLHPTLMVIDPKISGSARAFWHAASCHGMFVA
jgi:hypothetical protein